MEYPPCERLNCINNKRGQCTLKDPEITDGSCLDYDDAMDALRLKADPIKGTLG